MVQNNLLHESLGELTDALLASYASDETTRRVGHTALPSRMKIVEILHELRQLLFPGYFGDKALSEQSVRFHVGDQLARVGEELVDQVTHCLCTERRCPTCPAPHGCTTEAEQMVRDFLAAIPEIRRKLALDAQAAYDGDPAAKSIEEIIYCYPGFYAVAVYRIAHELLRVGVPLMPRIMTEYAHHTTGTDIHPGAEIGESLFIDHATGVVIGETTKIGNHVKIYQGVTLGAKSFPKDERGRVIKGLKRHPTIEDHVTIYPNATILGGETVIGRGVTVGGNAYITESVPPDSLVRQPEFQLEVLSKSARRHPAGEKAT